MIERIDAAEALNRELALLEDVSHHPDRRHLHFWESPGCLVAPMSFKGKPNFQEAVERLGTAGWPVHSRSTGGDATPQGPGIFNLTHVYANPSGMQIDLAREYDRLCTSIERALGPGASRGWQPGAFCDGAYNVQLNGLKFAGTALRIRRCKADRSRHAVLAHAIMLAEPVAAEAISAINTFLTLLGEDREIEIAAHTHLPDGLSADEFVAKLTAEIDAAGPETRSMR